MKSRFICCALMLCLFSLFHAEAKGEGLLTTGVAKTHYISVDYAYERDQYLMTVYNDHFLAFPKTKVYAYDSDFDTATQVMSSYHVLPLGDILFSDQYVCYSYHVPMVLSAKLCLYSMNNHRHISFGKDFFRIKYFSYPNIYYTTESVGGYSDALHCLILPDRTDTIVLNQIYVMKVFGDRCYYYTMPTVLEFYPVYCYEFESGNHCRSQWHSRMKMLDQYVFDRDTYRLYDYQENSWDLSSLLSDKKYEYDYVINDQWLILRQEDGQGVRVYKLPDADSFMDITFPDISTIYQICYCNNRLFLFPYRNWYHWYANENTLTFYIIDLVSGQINTSRLPS